MIAYIASQFRKDKIWLRRTQPDKRRYQVLLAIDNSLSMTEMGCAPFALQSLALISRSMNRLEVGEFGVISFGGSSGPQYLHGLDRPFTDMDGVRIMSKVRDRGRLRRNRTRCASRLAHRGGHEGAKAAQFARAPHPAPRAVGLSLPAFRASSRRPLSPALAPPSHFSPFRSPRRSWTLTTTTRFKIAPSWTC